MIQTLTPDDVTLQVDGSAIEWNTRLIANRVPVPLLAVVKSDGYGHGATAVARAALAGGASLLGVTGLGEASRLREAGIDAPILSWMNRADADGAQAVALRTAVAVASPEQLRAAARSGSGVAVHLQLDTGMARDGAPESEWHALATTAAELAGRGDIDVVGVMSHLAFADTPSHPRTAEALERFRRGVALVRSTGLDPAHIHVAATSAALSDPSTHGTLVRVGAGLVGVDLSGTLALRPAMRLSCRLAEVREVAAGTSVGYGGSFTARRRTRLGLVPVGYGDGLPRVPSGRAHVTIDGRRRSVVGSVSMNSIVVDLGVDGRESVGDTVTLLGDSLDGEPTAADWAGWAGTIPQDILTAIGRAGRRP